MDIFIALLGGVVGTLIVQGLLRSFRAYRVRVEEERRKVELNKELGGRLKAINAARGVKNFESALMESSVIKDRPNSIEEMDKKAQAELDKELDFGSDTIVRGLQKIPRKRMSADDVPGDRPLKYNEVHQQT